MANETTYTGTAAELAALCDQHPECLDRLADDVERADDDPDGAVEHAERWDG